MEKKLQVRNLRISFRTSNGKVQAVRDISFDLDKGETLAIVGESGSGKSVTSKAILGIQAGNSITESGEIIYDGKDLLKISEEEFHKIRGDKISMIFQDPMSSLNPIVKIGRQLTEAMILKGKARQRESRNNFNGYLKALGESMVAQLTQCIRFNLDCADICAAAGSIASRRTGSNEQLIGQILAACATACKTCGDKCASHADMHEHCRICAEACRRCEAACNEAKQSIVSLH